MKWTFSQLQKYRDKGFYFDTIYDAGEIMKLDQSIRNVSPIHVSGRADIAPERITFHLKIKGYMILPCSRTLVDVKYPVDVETTETFLLNSTEYEAGEEVHLANGEMIDLRPIIEE